MPTLPNEEKALHKVPSKDASVPLAEPTRSLTPLGIILEVMHARYREGDLEAAVALARLAAPYIHPRVPATRLAADLATVPDADLDAVRPHV